jgi:hypothetical protein
MSTAASTARHFGIAAGCELLLRWEAEVVLGPFRPTRQTCAMATTGRGRARPADSAQGPSRPRAQRRFDQRKTTQSEMDPKEQRAALRAAVMQRVDGASELARNLVVELRQRGWDGDDDLADQLDTLLGSGPAPMLRPLPVDLEELAGILEGDPLSAGGCIDIRTGEVWPRSAIDYACASRSKAAARSAASNALSEERQRGRARSWLAAAGYRVLPADHNDP